MPNREQAVEMLLSLGEAIGWNIAVFHRGGTGKQSGKRQERAFVNVFTALTGEKPTQEELDKMGGSNVFGGIS